MNLSDDAHRSLLAEFRERLLPGYLTQMDQVSAEHAIHSAISSELQRLGDHTFAEAFAAAIGVGSSGDYLPRVIDVEGMPFLCGIRFYGGDRRQPFVELIAGPAIADDCSTAALAAMDAYAMFQPARARVLMSGSHAPRVRAGWHVETDQVIAMAPASAMARLASSCAQAGSEALDLVPAAPDEAAAFLVPGYARVAAADPDLGSRLFPATSDDLESCRADGHLWWWTVQGERAGLIAARNDEVLGIRGLLMVEELVAAKFAGRGTAALAQRELAKRACASCADVKIVGTIDAANAPSRATARRAGRAEVAAWHFLSPNAGRGV